MGGGGVSNTVYKYGCLFTNASESCSKMLLKMLVRIVGLCFTPLKMSLYIDFSCIVPGFQSTFGCNDWALWHSQSQLDQMNVVVSDAVPRYWRIWVLTHLRMLDYKWWIINQPCPVVSVECLKCDTWCCRVPSNSSDAYKGSVVENFHQCTMACKHCLCI